MNVPVSRSHVWGLGVEQNIVYLYYFVFLKGTQLLFFYLQMLITEKVLYISLFLFVGPPACRKGPMESLPSVR